MPTATNKGGLREKKYRVGGRVKFLFPTDVLEGTIVEDRGPIGRGGRRLWRVEWSYESGDVHAIELGAEDFLTDQGPIDLGGIHLAGPYTEPAELPARPGVYAVLDNRN